MPAKKLDPRAFQAPSATSVDETAIFSPRPSDSQGDSRESRLREAVRGQVALVEGSAPHLTSETSDLLRSRLRIAAVLFFVGFATFFIRSLFDLDEWANPEHRWLLITHGCVTLLLGAVAAWLYRRGPLSSAKLRLAELLVFGNPALFFITVGIHNVLHTSRLPAGQSHLPILIVPWLMLIFTYALFIPNTWPRALAVLGPMGAAPVAMLSFLWIACAEFGHLCHQAEYSGYISDQLMTMGLAVLVATVGVHTIGTLRREAFTARQLGQYRLKQRIGSGGMGEVYLAEHAMMKRPCAVKIIRPEMAGDPKALARFEREVRATAKLSHWNSIDIYDYGRTADGTFYYVMEYLPGHHVGELIEMEGPMPVGRVVYLMNQFCAALAEAHAIGLVHRDIKPANLFCAYRGGEYDVAKLLDFGLAKPMVEPGDMHLTQAGVITGSPLYMSPEQATGDAAMDARSDIYSLGAVMYYLLTGQSPFAYDNPVKVMIAHASEAVAPLRDLRPEIPYQLEEIILRCLEKDPGDRFQTATALRQALQDVELEEPWSSDQAAAWWTCNGCPERKAMAAAALEAAAV